MVHDPIADMLTQIKNASLVGKKTVELPFSRIKQNVATVLAKEGYLADVEKRGEDPKPTLFLTLKYNGKDPAITDLKRKSKPGLRRYVDKSSIPMVVGGMGIAILSTSAGIMTGKEAKKRGLGGELLCEIW